MDYQLMHSLDKILKSIKKGKRTPPKSQLDYYIFLEKRELIKREVVEYYLTVAGEYKLEQGGFVASEREKVASYNRSRSMFYFGFIQLSIAIFLFGYTIVKKNKNVFEISVNASEVIEIQQDSIPLKGILLKFDSGNPIIEE